MKPILVRKGPAGYYVDDAGREAMNVGQLKFAPGASEVAAVRHPLHVKLALEGAEIVFDNRYPMVVTDVNGRKLRVTYDSKISEVVDLSEPDVVLDAFEVSVDSIFWFIVAGVPEQ